MRRRWIAPGVIACLLLVVAAGGYRWGQRSRQHRPALPRVALGVTVVAPSSSPTGWKPVPLPITPGAPRAIPLVDDPAARTRACGPWDAQATGIAGWTQRACVARLASGERRPPGAGAGVSVAKMRWSMAATAYGVPCSPGPPTDTWVIVVRLGYPENTTVAIILDDGTGTPYLRIDNG